MSARPIYDRARYLADLARLDALRASEAPGLRATLAGALTAELPAPASVPAPASGVVPRRRDTAPGGFVAAPVAATIPASPAVLRAAGLGPRPRGATGKLRCHWPAVALAVLAVLLGAPGCGAPSELSGATGNAADELKPAEPALIVWPADTELWALTQAVADRLARATGLRVVTSDAGGAGSDRAPLFWSPRGSDEGWLGICAGDWLAIDPATPRELREMVVLHEILHALGAQHVETGEGVLTDAVWQRPEGWSLTAADLEALCVDARDDCTRFVPEATP